MLKRLFDILASAMGLIVLSPIMCIIAAAIRIESKGPAIFKQRRAGMHGNPFVMYKFRSMSIAADPYGVSPRNGNDPRMTRVGKFLRETSLDELPQLFNVLIGSMSLVGPRPLYERQAELWTPQQQKRLDVRPGITGYAQVKGRGSITIEEKIDMDLFYVKNRSFWMDIKLLFQTVFASLRGESDIYEKKYSKTSDTENKASDESIECHKD